MWKILRGARQLAVSLIVTAAAFTTVEANAQDTTITQTTSGFNLPGVQLPQGHDEVRAADGTTCRSAVSGSGAYIDVGFIGNPNQSSESAGFSAYGRMVIPLAKKTPRLDCSKLYNLEVARLEMELKLMQMGLTRGIAPVSESVSEEVSMDVDTASVAKDAKPAAKKPIRVASLDTPKKASSTGADWADDGWSTQGLDK